MQSPIEERVKMPELDKIYSSTALATKQREVKEAARKNVVRITENGNGAFVFCSEEVFERELARAAEDARYEAELEMAISRGRADIEAGRYTTDIAAFAEDVRKARGLDG